MEMDFHQKNPSRNLNTKINEKLLYKERIIKMNLDNFIINTDDSLNVAIEKFH